MQAKYTSVMNGKSLDFMRFYRPFGGLVWGINILTIVYIDYTSVRFKYSIYFRKIWIIDRWIDDGWEDTPCASSDTPKQIWCT